MGGSWGALVGHQVTGVNFEYLLVAVVGLLVFILCLVRIDWALWLLVCLSPFHYAIKELSSSFVVDVWRELFLALLLCGWLVQVLLRKRPLPPDDPLTCVLIVYLLWGLAEIFNSATVLVGVLGFRFMFSFVPVYFVAVSTVTRETHVKRLMKGILASGLIVAVIGIVQFILVSVLEVVELGTSIDFARKYAPSSFRAAGIAFDRSNSILVGPNELGVFMSICLTLMLSYHMSAGETTRGRRVFRVIAMIILGLGLLVSMSRSSMIGFVTAAVAVSIVKRRATKTFGALAAVVLILVWAVPAFLGPLFSTVFSFSDRYFESTLPSVVSDETVWGAPLIGHGYGLTPSVSEKMGIDDPTVLVLGGVDVYAAQSIAQIGLIGFALFMASWCLFLRRAYVGSRRREGPEFLRATAAGIFGALIGTMVTSAHVAAWDYVSFAAGYYVVGAIANRIGAATPEPARARAPADGTSIVLGSPGKRRS